MENIQSVTQKLGLMALDALLARHEVLAANIANVHTDGYVAKRLNFEEQLGSLRAAVADGADAETLNALIDQVHPFSEAIPSSTSNPAAKSTLDDAMTAIVQNSMQYEAILTTLRQTAIFGRIAVTGVAA